MFQASLLKRASRYVPAAAAAAGGVAGIAFATNNNIDDKYYHVERRSGNVAICEGKKTESVMGMLGDIQEKVRSCAWYVCI